MEDSYGPVTDNAQSVYELSLTEPDPAIRADLRRTMGFEPDPQAAKLLLEENDGAGNTFKATAKPVFAWRSFYRLRIESSEVVEKKAMALSSEAA